MIRNGMSKGDGQMQRAGARARGRAAERQEGAFLQCHMTNDW